MHSRGNHLGVSASFLLLGLTACSSSPSPNPGAARVDLLSEVLGPQSPAKLQAGQAKAEKKIAECMRKEGFSYIPYTRSQSQTPSGPKPGGEVEWKRKNGFGMSASLEAVGSPVSRPSVDPNQAIVNSLSPEEQGTYQKALFGAQSSTVEESTGCTFFGYSGGGNKDLTFLEQQLRPKFEALSIRIQLDPRMVKAASQWTTCMREKGNEGIRTELDIFDKILNPAYNKILETAMQPASEAAAALPGLDEKKVAEFRKIEFALAADDADCSAKVAKVRQAVTEEYQAKFLEQNRANLVRVKAAQEAP